MREPVIQQRGSSYGLRAVTTGSAGGFSQYRNEEQTTGSRFDEVDAPIPNENSSIRNGDSYIDEDTPELHPMSLRSADHEIHRNQSSTDGKFD